MSAMLMAGTPATAPAQDAANGTIVIARPWARATPSGAKVGGGYLTLTNKGNQLDRFVSITTDVAERAEIHQMSMKAGVMSMQELPGGLDIPPGGSVELKPGSVHVMLFGLRHPLKQGEHFSSTLGFEKARPVTVDFSIEPIGATQPAR